MKVGDKFLNKIIANHICQFIKIIISYDQAGFILAFKTGLKFKN